MLDEALRTGNKDDGGDIGTVSPRTERLPGFTRVISNVSVSLVTSVLQEILADRFPHLTNEGDRAHYAAELLGLSRAEEIAQVFLDVYGTQTAAALGAVASVRGRTLSDVAPQLEARMRTSLEQAFSVAASVRNAIRCIIGTQKDPRAIRNVDMADNDVVVEGVANETVGAIMRRVSPQLIGPILRGGGANAPTDEEIQAAVRNREIAA